MRVVAEESGLEVELLTARDDGGRLLLEPRTRRARNVAMYLMHKLMPMTLAAVAEYFKCAPSTVMKAADRMEKAQGRDSKLFEQIRKITEKLAETSDAESKEGPESAS